MKNLTGKNLQILQLNILMIIILQNKEQELVGFKTYLNEKSKKIMTSKSVDAHGETSKIFKHHEKFKKGNKGKIISKNLNKLRKMRNQVDYDKIISTPLSQMINDSEKLSKRILELLNELN